MSEYQIGKDLENLRQRIEVLENALPTMDQAHPPITHSNGLPLPDPALANFNKVAPDGWRHTIFVTNLMHWYNFPIPPDWPTFEIAVGEVNVKFNGYEHELNPYPTFDITTLPTVPDTLGAIQINAIDGSHQSWLLRQNQIGQDDFEPITVSGFGIYHFNTSMSIRYDDPPRRFDYTPFTSGYFTGYYKLHYRQA